MLAITTDAGDNVASIAGNGDLFDTAQLTLSENLDLSDDANNTITFRIKPIADYGVRTHLLKFEGGTGPNTELSFTTTGSAWQNISLDYPAGLGNYDLVVFFPDFNTADVGTYLVDDFAGGTNIAPVPDLQVPSPTPTTPDNEVLSVYGDTGNYTNIWISSYNYFHFDYWTSNATQIRMILIEEDGTVQEYFYELPTEESFVFNEWRSVDIPLTFFTAQGFSTDKFFQYKIGTLSDLDTGIAYFDNLYFSVNPGTNLSVDEFNISTFNVFPNPTKNHWTINASSPIKTIEVFNILGKTIFKTQENNNTVNIDAANMQSGIYLARISTNSGTQTIKLVKH